MDNDQFTPTNQTGGDEPDRSPDPAGAAYQPYQAAGGSGSPDQPAYDAGQNQPADTSQQPVPSAQPGSTQPPVQIPGHGVHITPPADEHNPYEPHPPTSGPGEFQAPAPTGTNDVPPPAEQPAANQPNTLPSAPGSQEAIELARRKLAGIDDTYSQTAGAATGEDSFDAQLHTALEKNQQLAQTAPTTPTAGQPSAAPQPGYPQPANFGAPRQQFGTLELPPTPPPSPQPITPQPPQPANGPAESAPAIQPGYPPPPPVDQYSAAPASQPVGQTAPESAQPQPTPHPEVAPPVYQPAQPVTPPAAQPDVSELGKSVQPTDVVGKWRSSVGRRAGNFAGLKDKVPHRLRHIIVAFLIGAGIFLAFNSQILVGQVEYLTSSGEGEEVPLITEATGATPVGPEPRIIIPKINVNVPVVYDEPSFEERKVQQALERGVVHYGNTALPGRPGNNVIVGHSSNNWWASGKYKFAFVLLDKLAMGDTFAVNYQGTQYMYEVFSKEIVAPNDFSVLTQGSEPITTLITCTPPGTSWKRLIVQAKQISPDPDLAAANGQDVPVEEIESPLPGNPPSLWDKIRDWLFGSGYIGLTR